MWILVLCAALSVSKKSPAAYFYNFNRPLIIAHRGASGYIPEHTMQAYDVAAYMGADFIEPDLVPTKDGHLLVNHDPLLDDTTNVAYLPQFSYLYTTKTMITVNGLVTQSGWFSEDFTMAQLKELRAIQRLPFRPQSMNDLFQKVSITEVLDWAIGINQQRIINNQPLLGVYIELKDPEYFNSVGYPVEKMLLEILRERNIDTIKGASEICPIILQCFELQSLEIMSKLSDLPLVYLINGNNIPFDMKDYAEIVNGVGPSSNIVFDPSGRETDFVYRAHEANLAVHLWVVRDDVPFGPFTRQQTYQALRNSGLDGVFDEFPDSASIYFNLV